MNRFTILHLSDAHIGHPMWALDQNTVMRPLLSDIKAISSSQPPELIVFSGDLVFGEVSGASMESQLAESKVWLENIHNIWGKQVGDIKLLLVPGNHDIQRSRIDESQTDWLRSQTAETGIEKHVKTGTTLWRRILERQDLWWSFVKAIPNQPWQYNDHLRISTGRIAFADKTIGIVGYNSSWCSSGENEKGKLWLTRHQFESGAHPIEDCDFRIAVIHHPVSWFHEREEAWLGPKLTSHFHLVLHGHLHNGWYNHLGDHACISGGACWAGSQKENAYYWIHLDLRQPAIELMARTYVDKGIGA